jgi:dTDP-4-amino-4,6-dideoxy-D-galactose acyltransferase
MVPNSLAIVDWDSSFFGYLIGRTDAQKITIESINEILDQAKNRNVKLLYLFMDEGDSISESSAEYVRAKLVDEKVTFRMNVRNKDVELDGHIELFELNKPSDKLIDLSIQSGLYSRYKTDTNFRNNEFEKLYTTWIVNSVNKQLADFTFVYRDEERELGFTTVKLNKDFGQIGLIAVDESSRGKSIGKKLIFSVIDLLKNKKIGELQVATQKDNTAACRFYQSLGFSEFKMEKVYHIWL